MAHKTKRLKYKLLKELAECGNVSIACKKTGASRASYYRWLEDDDDFRQKSETAIEKGTASLIDMAESKLLQHIGKSDLGAIKFFLTKRDPRYGSGSPNKSISKPMALSDLFKKYMKRDKDDSSIK